MMLSLDWSDLDHWGGGRRQPCRTCGKPSILRDDAKRPCHKKCVEDALNRRHLEAAQPEEDGCTGPMTEVIGPMSGAMTAAEQAHREHIREQWKQHGILPRLEP